MKLYLSLVLLLAFALVLGGCTQPPAAPVAKGPTQAEDVAALVALGPQYENAYAASDASTLAAVFTEDGVRMPPNKPAIVGKSAILSSFQSEFAEYSKTLASRTVNITRDDVQISGDWAYISGRYAGKGTPRAAGAKALEFSGKWLGVYRRDGGAWKLHRHCWNSDLPVPPVK